MELFEAIRSRRSVKKFATTPVPRELIEQALEAALWAPSGQNLQPVRFWVISDRQILPELEANLYQYGLRLKKLRPLLRFLVPQFRGEKGEKVFRSLRPTLFNGAPVLVLVGAERNSSSTYAKDCTLAAMNLMLAAHGLGIGSCYFGWVTLLSRLSHWKRRLGIPEGVEIVDGIGLGYAAGERQAPLRKPLSEVTTWVGENTRVLNL